MKATTRKEQQAETRSRLMSSAAKLFCQRGLEGASVEEVAREAGYTKGAFYANFRSKEALFLAMMDEKFAAEIARLDTALHTGAEMEEQVREASEDFIRVATADSEWPRLFLEFAAYAGRNAEFREEFMARYRAMHERLTKLYRGRIEELGIEPPLPVEEIAMMTTCMANGFLLEQMLDQDLGEELYGMMVGTFFRGLGAMLEEQDPDAFARIAGA